MVDVGELRKTLTKMKWAASNEFVFPASFVRANVIHPFLELLDVMESNRGERWRTLKEAISESGRTHNYFEKRLRRLGGRNRLETWRAQGLADQTSEGLWLISPIMVAQAAVDEMDDTNTSNATASGVRVGIAEEIIERFKRKSA